MGGSVSSCSEQLSITTLGTGFGEQLCGTGLGRTQEEADDDVEKEDDDDDDDEDENVEEGDERIIILLLRKMRYVEIY